MICQICSLDFQEIESLQNHTKFFHELNMVENMKTNFEESTSKKIKKKDTVIST